MFDFLKPLSKEEQELYDYIKGILEKGEDLTCNFVGRIQYKPEGSEPIYIDYNEILLGEIRDSYSIFTFSERLSHKILPLYKKTLKMLSKKVKEEKLEEDRKRIQNVNSVLKNYLKDKL